MREEQWVRPPLPRDHALKIVMKLIVGILCLLIVFSGVALLKVDQLVEIIQTLKKAKQAGSFQQFMDPKDQKSLDKQALEKNRRALEKETRMVDEALKVAPKPTD